MYATIDDYTALYGTIEQEEFNRLALEADRAMDRATSGIDNVRKLVVAYPETDADIIKACACRIINLLKQIYDAEAAAESARGYVQGAAGLQGKAVSSMSAGNESVSFAASSNSTAIDRAIADPVARDRLIKNTINVWLSGLEDANGVNLFYMGAYPAQEETDV